MQELPAVEVAQNQRRFSQVPEVEPVWFTRAVAERFCSYVSVSL